MQLKKALSVLAAGGVIAHATDTCYGFACDIFNKEALRRLYRLKQMDSLKPVSILVADLNMARRFGFFSKAALALAKKHWPGAVTIIVKRKRSLPAFLNFTSRTVGFRVPAHKLSLELVKKFGRPLTTTSANISGQPAPYSVSAIKKQFCGRRLKSDFIINLGRLKRNLPSTIIDYSKNPPKIIRQGSLFFL